MKKQVNKCFMGVVAVAMLMLNAGISLAQAQSGRKVPERVAQLKQQDAFINEYQLFSPAARTAANDLSKSLRNYTLLTLNSGVTELVNTKPDYIKLVIPVENGARSLPVLLYKVDISPNGFTLLTSDGRSLPANSRIVNYRGAIENDNNSVAAVTISDNEIMGMISNADGDYVLGKLEDNSGSHVIYNDNDMVVPFSFDCGTNTSIIPKNQVNNPPPNSTQSVKCVNWYYEIDYDVYVNKGSNVDTVNAFINGIFNQVSTLYANDGMSITLQTVYVWTSTDPYTGPSTSNYLTQFGTTRTSFAGDLATLIGYAGGGGVAWINGFCNSQAKYKQSYCGISSSYNTVPTYSWTVEVVAHEQGHLFGSRHTHDCVWNGNSTAIDGCGPAAGYSGGSCPAGPIPSSSVGGTIMSYCHLVSAGIKFANGFGPQPASLMLNNENNASCLSACCAPPAQPGTISGNASVCQSSSQTYSIASVSGATSYGWTLPSGWSGSSTSTSITAIAGGTGGTISVTANSASCGSSPARTLAVTASPVPAQPGTITGSTSACPGSAQTYSVSAVSGATSYTWTLPSGWSGASTTTSINTTAGSAGGTISVKANNSCGSGTARTLSVSAGPVPAQPGTITGSASACQSSSQTYSVSAVSGATSYTWTLPSGWSGTSTTTSITTTAGSAGGTISVKANNGCGSSAARTLAVTVSPVPAQPGSIAGNVSACQSSSQTYSVSAVSGATSYTWTLPSGWSGTSTTTSITTTAGSAGGTVSVKANNACGSSAARTISVTVSVLPGQPATITGNKSGICNLSAVPYSVTNVAGTTYTWSFSAGGATIASGQGTSAVTVNYTSAYSTGTLTVTPSNACGAGTARTATIKSAPATPGAITGSASVCANQQGVPYSIAAVANTTNYTWVGPTGSHIKVGTTVSSGNSLTTTSTSVAVNFGSTSGIVKVRANNSCGSGTYKKLTVNFTCREDDTDIAANSGAALVYPNPASDRLNITVDAEANSSVKLILTDMAGRTVVTENKLTNEGSNAFQIDLSRLTKGIYLLEINNGIRIQKTKVVVE